MSRKEVPRPGLVKLALAGQITNQQGAAGSKLTIRQFQRVKARYRAERLRGLLHRRRGQPSPRALPSALRARVAALLQSVYRASMTATPPRSSGTSKACPSAGPPCGGSARLSACRPSTAGAPGNIAAVAPRPMRPRAARWQSVRLAGGPRAHHDAPRRHRRRHRHGRGVVLPPDRGSSRLRHAARPARPTPRPAPDALRRSPQRLRPQ